MRTYGKAHDISEIYHEVKLVTKQLAYCGEKIHNMTMTRPKNSTLCDKCVEVKLRYKNDKKRK